MTTRSPMLMGLAALVLTACAMALSGPGAISQAHVIQGVPIQGTVQKLPLACSLTARAEGAGTVLQGHLEAREALSASYALRVRGPGVSIDQAGSLSLAAGESAVLGQAFVSGPGDALDATLTVTAGGRSYACPVQPQ